MAASLLSAWPLHGQQNSILASGWAELRGSPPRTTADPRPDLSPPRLVSPLITADLMAQRGTYLVPTLITYHQLLEGGAAAGMAPELVAKVGSLVEQVGPRPGTNGSRQPQLHLASGLESREAAACQAAQVAAIEPPACINGCMLCCVRLESAPPQPPACRPAPAVMCHEYLAAELPTSHRVRPAQGLASLRLAAQHGVEMAFGSDLLGDLHGAQLREFELRSRVLPAKVGVAAKVGAAGWVRPAKVGAAARRGVL